jgi:peptidyl-tRNA hydrolase, PTH2 family
MKKRAKQVIIMRSDLRDTQNRPVPKGKLIAQGCHASLGAILRYFNKQVLINTYLIEADFDLDSPMKQWLTGSFFKIVLRVDSEEELMEIYNKGTEAGLYPILIEDLGHTCFDMNKTATCVGFPPLWDEHIDPITKHLRLF